MNTLDLRSEISRLLQVEKDASVLELIRRILQRKIGADPWQDAMIERALKAEEEIKAGKWSSIDEAFRDLGSSERP